MSIFNRNKTNKTLENNSATTTRLEMVTDVGNGFYAWDGGLFKSDIVRACIRPKVKAIGKLVAKHIRTTVNKDGKKNINVNPEPYIRFLLEEPNPYMTSQVMQEKLATQLALNNNAFALIIRDENGYPTEIYPIPTVSVEAIYNNNAELYLKFYFKNGKKSIFKYSDIIHLRQDFYENDIFGTSPVPALTSLMEIINTTDQGIIKAIKNGAVIRWLLKFTNSLRPEDLKKQAEEFAENYMALSNSSLGVAATDGKVDATQVDPKDYVPNALIVNGVKQRIYEFFNTNENITQSKWSEDDWIAYYEAEIEPVALQLSNEYTRKIFSRKEIGFGNKILFEARNLQYASLNTKLALVQMVDRGAMTPNEWREALCFAPIDGGDEPIRRLDTAVVNKIETMLNDFNNKINKNYENILDIVSKKKK